jgi:hypothetical protein
VEVPRLHVLSLHPSFACQTALPYRPLPRVKFDGLGPVANRFYETLQRGRANRPKPIDCHQITDRQKLEPYSETGTCGAKVASALAAQPSPRQHLIQKQFLAPLTSPRCPLLGKKCLTGSTLLAIYCSACTRHGDVPGGTKTCNLFNGGPQIREQGGKGPLLHSASFLPLQ